MTPVQNPTASVGAGRAGLDGAALVCRVLFALALLGLAIHFVAYAYGAVQAVLYPYELDYGEGIVWQQALLIPTGGPPGTMYGDVNTFPFLVFHYPPLYHLVVRAVSALGPNMLLAGRAVSLIATLAACLLGGAIAFMCARGMCSRRNAVIGALAACLAFPCCWPVVAWSYLMRVDMLAAALSLAGMWLALHDRPAPASLFRVLDLAAIAFAAAIFTKQTSLAAPAATMAIMAAADPRRAARACALGAGVSLLALGALSWATEGRFLTHVVSYNVNRFSLGVALQSLREEAQVHLVYVVCAVIALAAAWRRHGRGIANRGWAAYRSRLRVDRPVRAMSILALYVVLSTMLSLLAGKSGAAVNYYIEWLAGLAMLTGIAVGVTLEAATTPGARAFLHNLYGVAIPALILLQAARMPATLGFDLDLGAPSNRGLGTLVDRIRAAENPVLSDDMVLTMLAGKVVPWEPAIITELASRGQWDERQAVEMIDGHRFAFVIVTGQEGEFMFDARHSPAVVAALRRAYPHAEEVAGRTVLTP